MGLYFESRNFASLIYINTHKENIYHEHQCTSAERDL